MHSLTAAFSSNPRFNYPPPEVSKPNYAHCYSKEHAVCTRDSHSLFIISFCIPCVPPYVIRQGTYIESSYLCEQVSRFTDHPFVSGIRLRRNLGQPLRTLVQRPSLVLQRCPRSGNTVHLLPPGAPSVPAHRRHHSLHGARRPRAGPVLGVVDHQVIQRLHAILCTPVLSACARIAAIADSTSATAYKALNPSSHCRRSPRSALPVVDSPDITGSSKWEVALSLRALPT
jgi:hypothetical protein